MILGGGGSNRKKHFHYAVALLLHATKCEVRLFLPLSFCRCVTRVCVVDVVGVGGLAEASPLCSHMPLALMNPSL